MKFFHLLKSTLGILEEEEETSLAFLYGKRIENINYLKDCSFKNSSLIARVLIFFVKVIKKTNFRKGSDRDFDTEVYFYSGTLNQFNSIQPTYKSIQRKGINSKLIIDSEISTDHEYQVVEFSLKELVISIIVFFIRAPYLLKQIRYNENRRFMYKYFDVFCLPYIYTPFFLNRLSQGRVKVSVSSNDHNPSNRCLRRVSKKLKIKTAYIQHASVSNLFPPLDYDYAFLDGSIALRVYESISEGRLPTGKVFLCGQQKKVLRRFEGNSIGIAINILDSFEVIESLIERLTKDYQVVVRTHPKQDRAFIDSLTDIIKSNTKIEWSDSNNDSLISFFSRISSMIASNSSIHLEAALSGIPTLYLSYKDDPIEDYYGYVKNGVSLNLDDISPSLSIREAEDYVQTSTYLESVRAYSETYGTRFLGRESELSANIIANEISGFEDYSPFTLCSEYKNVYCLSQELSNIENEKY